MTGATRPLVRSLNAKTGRIRVLVVDDSLVIRHLLEKALEEAPDVEVVGTAANGLLALEQIARLAPDVVTLDIEMPEMDGLAALRRIRKEYPKLRTVMFSTLTTRGASATFEALALGADDYVAKAANAGSLDKSLVALRSELVPKIRQFFAVPGVPAPVPAARAEVRRGPAKLFPRPRLLAVGVSTGGPQALSNFIPRLPADFPLPVLIVQHMPPMFTRLLAERLASASALQVVEAAEGMEVQPGRVLIAPGDHHLRITRSGARLVAALDQSPQENSCRPAVDVLFRSAAEVLHGEVLSVVLTGMGADGLKGTRVLKQAGAYSIVQDQASSVVWGMPGAIHQSGLADQTLPLGDIAPEIVRLVGP